MRTISISIETLCGDIQAAMVTEINRRYGIKVDKNQIKRIPLRLFECNLSIANENTTDESYTFTVIDFKRPTYVANLKIPKEKDSKTEYTKLTKFYQDTSEDGINFECRVSDNKKYERNFEINYQKKKQVNNKPQSKESSDADKIEKKFSNINNLVDDLQNGTKIELEIRKISDRIEVLKQAKEKDFQEKINEILRNLDDKIQVPEEMNDVDSYIEKSNKRLQEISDGQKEYLKQIEEIKNSISDKKTFDFSSFNQTITDYANEVILNATISHRADLEKLNQKHGIKFREYLDNLNDYGYLFN